MVFQRLRMSPNTSSELLPPGSSTNDDWSPVNHQAAFAGINESIVRAGNSGQTPTLANPNSFPFWAPGDQLSPNGQIYSTKFLQASQLVNKRLHSSCSPLLNLAEGRSLAPINWAMTKNWAGWDSDDSNWVNFINPWYWIQSTLYFDNTGILFLEHLWEHLMCITYHL